MGEDLPYSITVTVNGDMAALETALRTIEPETGESDRTRVTINLKDEILTLTIDAADPTALRAAMNSYLRWLNEALEVFERTHTR